MGHGSSSQVNLCLCISLLLYLCMFVMCICIFVYLCTWCTCVGEQVPWLPCPGRAGQQQPSEMKSATARRGLHHQQNTLAAKIGVINFLERTNIFPQILGVLIKVSTKIVLSKSLLGSLCGAL